MTATERASTPHRRPSIVGPVVLILFGAVLLLQNLGILHWGLWTEIWRFWPVLLILLGVEVLLGRSSVGGAIAFGLLIALAAAVLGFSSWWSGGLFTSNWWPGTGLIVTEQLTRPRSGVFHASYHIETSAGRLSVDALPGGDPQLYAGSVRHDGRLVQQVAGTGDVQVRLAIEGSRTAAEQSLTGADWSLSLSPEVPADLAVRTGAGESTLDLSNLRIQTLDLDTGAGKTSVTLPRTAFQRGQVNGGVGEITVTVPDGVAIRIAASQSIGSIEANQARFVRTASGWETADYATAASRADLTVRSGIGAIHIR